MYNVSIVLTDYYIYNNYLKVNANKEISMSLAFETFKIFRFLLVL